MNIDFNAGKKVNKISDDEDKEEIIEETEVHETEVTNNSSNNYDKDELKKRLAKVCGIILLFFVLILLVILLSSVLAGKNYTYGDVENVMKESAIAYFKDNQHQLPKEGNTVTITSDNLADTGYMKPLEKYLGSGNSCSGRVDVENDGVNYVYSPYLDCGNDYKTIELYKKLTSEGSVVTSGYGLYSNRGEYVFRGETVNNYVKLDNALWRVVKIKSDNTLELILANTSVVTKCFDDRYNKNVKFSSGINTYSTSRIKDLINTIYDGTASIPGYSEEDYMLIGKDDRGKIAAIDACVGKRTEEDSSKDNSAECSEKLRGQYISLLTSSDYMMASLDTDCTSTTARSCANFNYLVDDNEWWLMTADKSNTSNAYLVGGGGTVTSESSSYYAGVRPVIYLKSNVLYKSGKGTATKPYKVK